MAFVTLVPHKLQPKPSQVIARFVISKKGKGTLFVSVPSVLAGKTWESFDCCDFQMGEGDDAGRLRIVAHEGGAFKIAHMKSALVFRVPAQPAWCAAAFGPVVVEAALRDPDMEITLPHELFTPHVKQVAVVLNTGVKGVDQRKPPLSIVGTTLELNNNRVKLNAGTFRAFNVLWKAYGEALHRNNIEGVLGEDMDVDRVISVLKDDLMDIGMTVSEDRPRKTFALQMMVKG
jgi:hypothetical protein